MVPPSPIITSSSLRRAVRLLAIAFLLIILILVLALAVLFLAAAMPRDKGKAYKVGGPDGWRMPPPEEKDAYYANWASNITFHVGDYIVFEYKNDTSVIRVDKAGYYHCTAALPAGAATARRHGTAIFRLDAPGYAYFASADFEHCKMGERLMINVLALSEMPAPGPSSSAAATAAVDAMLLGLLVVVPAVVALLAG